MEFAFPVFVRASNTAAPPAPPQKSLWQLVIESGPNDVIPERAVTRRAMTNYADDHGRDGDVQSAQRGVNGDDDYMTGGMSSSNTAAAACVPTSRSSWTPAAYMVEHLMSSGFASQFAMLHGIECSARVPPPPCLRLEDLQLPQLVLERLRRQLFLPRKPEVLVGSAVVSQELSQPNLRELQEIVFSTCDDTNRDNKCENTAREQLGVLTALQQLTLTSMLLGHHTVSVGPSGVGKKTAGLLATGALALSRGANSTEENNKNNKTDDNNDNDNNDDSVAEVRQGPSDTHMMRPHAPQAMILVSSFREVQRCSRWLQDVFTAEAFVPMTFRRGSAELVPLPLPHGTRSIHPPPPPPQQSASRFLQPPPGLLPFPQSEATSIHHFTPQDNHQNDSAPHKRSRDHSRNRHRHRDRDDHRNHHSRRSESPTARERVEDRRHRSSSRHNSQERRHHRRSYSRDRHHRNNHKRRRSSRRRHRHRSRSSSSSSNKDVGSSDRRRHEKDNKKRRREDSRSRHHHHHHHREDRHHESAPQESPIEQLTLSSVALAGVTATHPSSAPSPFLLPAATTTTIHNASTVASSCNEVPQYLRQRVPLLIATHQSLAEALEFVQGQAEVLPLEYVRTVYMSDADRMAQPTSQISVPMSWWISLSNAVDVDCQYIVSATRMYDEIDEWLQKTFLRETPDVVNRYRQRDDTVWSQVQHILDEVAVDEADDRASQHMFERVESAKMRRLIDIVTRHFHSSHAASTVDRFAMAETDDPTVTVPAGRVVVVVSSRREQDSVFPQLLDGLRDCGVSIRCTCQMADFQRGEADVLVTYDWVLCLASDDDSMSTRPVDVVVNFGFPRALMAPGKENGLLDCLVIRARKLLHRTTAGDNRREVEENKSASFDDGAHTARMQRTVVTFLTEHQIRGRFGRLLTSRAQAILSM